MYTGLVYFHIFDIGLPYCLLAIAPPRAWGLPRLARSHERDPRPRGASIVWAPQPSGEIFIDFYIYIYIYPVYIYIYMYIYAPI